MSQAKMLATLNHLFPADGNDNYFKSKINEKNDEGSRESLYALIILSKALQLLPSHVDIDKLTFAQDAGGKPYFKQSSIYFNVSHSKGYVACCVSDECDVGVDIEASEIAPEKSVKLAKRFFTESQAEAVKRNPQIFTEIWSEKESEAKLFGKDLCQLLKDQKSVRFACSENKEIRFHHFKIGNIPLTACTNRNFSTILFKFIQ